MSAELERAPRFVPANLDERARFAQMLAKADMLPQQYRDRPGNVLLVMEYGDSLQIPYAQAISTINVIDGKVSASAALISALVRRAGHRLRVKGDDTEAWAEIVRSDDPDFTYRSEWNLGRAERAGLCQVKDGRVHARSKSGKPLPWEAYTAALLKARAITEVAREACQEALMGIQYTPEELGAVVDEDGNPVDTRTAGQRRMVQADAEVTVAKPKPKPKPKPTSTAKTSARPEPEQAPDPGPDDIIDAEIIEPEPHLTADDYRLADPPSPGTSARPTLPDDFDAIVQNAENNLDKQSLLDLHALAEASGNRMAVASVIAAGKRVAAELADQEGQNA